MKVLFVNENIGGHATVHHHLRLALDAVPDVDARFLDVPTAGPVRRVIGASVPGLGRLDLDLQPIRAQLALSAWVARRLERLAADVDVIHLYTQNAGLLSAATFRRVPTLGTPTGCRTGRRPASPRWPYPCRSGSSAACSMRPTA